MFSFFLSHRPHQHQECSPVSSLNVITTVVIVFQIQCLCLFCPILPASVLLVNTQAFCFELLVSSYSKFCFVNQDSNVRTRISSNSVSQTPTQRSACNSDDLLNSLQTLDYKTQKRMRLMYTRVFWATNLVDVNMDRQNLLCKNQQHLNVYFQRSEQAIKSFAVWTKLPNEDVSVDDQTARESKQIQMLHSCDVDVDVETNKLLLTFRSISHSSLAIMSKGWQCKRNLAILRTPNIDTENNENRLFPQ